MKFGDTDVNESLDWSTWSWEDFLSFYGNSLKNVKETPEEVAKALGVVIPEKVKPDKVKDKGSDA